MSSLSSRVFGYEAAGGDGRLVKGQITAPDEATAMRRLSADGLMVTKLLPAVAPKAQGRDRPLRPAERVLVLRQLALMLEAGVSLLEALETVSQGLESLRGKKQFQAAVAALRRGSSLGAALEEHVPGFPAYVYAMARVGEASGGVSDVLKEAAEQMAYEDRLQREFANALTYPAFLSFAGFAAVGFIFTQVVPRFADMVGEDRSKVPAMSRWVLAAGEFANQNVALMGLGFAAFLGLVFLIVTNRSIRVRAYGLAHGLPVIGAVLQSREIASWARLTAFALNNGVPMLSAVALSKAAVPYGPFSAGLERLDSDLRAGLTLDASLAQLNRLEAMDLSLLRAGQKSGTIGTMLGFMADNYEGRLKDRMKRLTSLLEPMAIGIVSIIVGFVALSLVLALSSVYDGVM